MLNDGEQGIFEEYLDNYGEVKVDGFGARVTIGNLTVILTYLFLAVNWTLPTTFPKQHLITSTNASKNAQGMNHPAANVPHLFSTV
jgi:hypothetical protein